LLRELTEFAARVPLTIYVLWVVWFVVAVGLMFYTGRQLRPVSEIHGEGPPQTIDLVNSPRATIYQAGGDITLVHPDAFVEIRSIDVEARLTCSLKPGAALLPSEVEFAPVGGSSAYLVGAGGRARLIFISPVRFRGVESDRVTVLNRFALGSGDGLRHRPVDALTAFDTLEVPIITVVYGNALESMQLLEVTLSINGDAVWYRAWNYSDQFQGGPVFTIPLGELHARLRDGSP